MRKTYSVAGLALLAIAGASEVTRAAPITHNVTLGATVLGACTISGNASVVSGAFAASPTQQSSIFTVGVTGSTASATTGELSIGTISCNSSTIKLTVSAPNGWIKRSSGPGEITYSAYLKDGSSTLNGGNAFISSALGTGPKVVTHAGSSLNLGLLISTQQATGLSAGSYSGALEVSVDAN
jgi:hypothetical protein